MTVSVDVWLRGTEHATTKTIEGLSREPADWTDEDVRFVLEEMLRVMAQLKQPGKDPQTIALRGLSWIERVRRRRRRHRDRDYARRRNRRSFRHRQGRARGDDHPRDGAARFAVLADGPLAGSKLTRSPGKLD